GGELAGTLLGGSAPSHERSALFVLRRGYPHAEVLPLADRPDRRASWRLLLLEVHAAKRTAGLPAASGGNPGPARAVPGPPRETAAARLSQRQHPAGPPRSAAGLRRQDGGMQPAN